MLVMWEQSLVERDGENGSENGTEAVSLGEEAKVGVNG